MEALYGGAGLFLVVVTLIALFAFSKTKVSIWGICMKHSGIDWLKDNYTPGGKQRKLMELREKEKDESKFLSSSQLEEARLEAFDGVKSTKKKEKLSLSQQDKLRASGKSNMEQKWTPKRESSKSKELAQSQSIDFARVYPVGADMSPSHNNVSESKSGYGSAEQLSKSSRKSRETHFILPYDANTETPSFFRRMMSNAVTPMAAEHTSPADRHDKEGAIGNSSRRQVVQHGSFIPKMEEAITHAPSNPFALDDDDDDYDDDERF